MIYYENSAGQIVRFDGPEIRVKESDLRSFAWDYTVANNPSGNGGSVSRFFRSIKQKEISLYIRGRSRASCIETLNNLHAITEVDIDSNQPGKLYLDGQYMSCYLGVTSELEEYRSGFSYALKKMEILAVSPFWNTELLQQFKPGDITVSQYGKRYNGRYPYQYGTGYSNKTIYNTHHTKTPAIIVIYGPCDNPQIYIEGVLYGIFATISHGERAVIDQLTRKIYKVAEDGEKTNLFDYRTKDDDVFTFIPSGEVHVQFSGEFGFDVTLIQQRSEPKWI